jgi:hypothetical protein
LTQPFSYIDSPYRHTTCGKLMVAEYGQHEVSGELVESHHCLSCGTTYNVRPEARSLEPHKLPVGAWMTVEQIAERRTQFLDRPEFLRNQPGLRQIVEEWADA